MEINKCFFCNQSIPTPIHITEVNDDGTLESIKVCENCGVKYMVNDSNESSKIVDMSDIKTPEDLLEFIEDLGFGKVKAAPCTACGLTEKEFDKTGRFGCPECYGHFKDKMEELVFPYHKNREHVGKKPKRSRLEKLMEDPIEKEKILKLRYAKALELEDYEKAGELKKQLNLLTQNNQSNPESSKDQ